MVVLVAFSTLALFGLSFSMHEDSQGMEHCAFMTETSSICPMTVLDHIATWQQMTTGLTVLFLMSIAIVVLTFSIRSTIQEYQKYRRKRLREHSPGIALFRLFLKLFASGILHSRVYA